MQKNTKDDKNVSYSGAIQNAITELHSVLRSQVMTRNVNVFVTAGAHFIYKITYIK